MARSNVNLLRLLAISGALNMMLILVGTTSSAKRASNNGVLDESIMFNPQNFSQPFATSANANATSYMKEEEVIASTPIEKILIIATVPYDVEHAMAVWTQLECLTDGIDKVIISAPDTPWCRDIVNAMIEEYKKLSGRGSSNDTTSFQIEASFHTNNRYDAGLWCDALSYHLGFDGESYSTIRATSPNTTFARNDNATTKPRAIFLTNDSGILIRRYKEITEQILQNTRKEQQNQTTTTTKVLKAISLNGVLQDPHNRKHYYIESVYRGFTPEGIQAFYKHSCVNMGSHCRGTQGRQAKSCIVNRYEISLADAYDAEEIDAMFPSKLPNLWDVGNRASTFLSRKSEKPMNPNELWIKGQRFYMYLFEEHGFPMRKVNKARVLHTAGAKECVSLMNGDFGWMSKKLVYPNGAVMKQFQEDMHQSAMNM